MFNLGTHTHSMTYSGCVLLLHFRHHFMKIYFLHILPQKLWAIKYVEDNYLEVIGTKKKKYAACLFHTLRECSAIKKERTDFKNLFSYHMYKSKTQIAHHWERKVKIIGWSACICIFRLWFFLYHSLISL